jgi:hypothetical protein
MADNIVLDAGSGGSTLATDDVGGVHYQIAKLAYGALNTANVVTSTATNPLPVALSDTDNAVLDNIQTAVQLIDNAISGSEMQVDVVAALPTGSNTIGEITIGTATTAATDLAKAEDAVHSSGDVGVMSLAVRNDSLAALAGADGDYAPLQVNATGALFIQEGAALDVSAATITVASHAVTNTGTFATQATLQAGTAAFGKLAAGTAEIGNVKNAGTFATQVDGSALTALQLIDNVVYTHDAAGGTAVGNMMMAQRDDEVGSTATTNSDGDAQALTTNKFGQLKTTEIADATSEVKYAVINAASGDNSIVAAAGSGVKIRVLDVTLVSSGTSDCRFETGAGGTALTGIMKLVANSGFSTGYCPVGHFETGDNAALSLEATGDIDGWLTYVLV